MGLEYKANSTLKINIYHINRLKKKSYDYQETQKKHLTKSKMYSWLKNLSKLGIEENFLTWYRAFRKILKIASNLIAKIWIFFPLRLGTKWVYMLLSLNFIQYCTRKFSQCKKKKKKKRNRKESRLERKKFK